MKNFGKLIPFYVVRSILPYFLFAWVLLSVILFVQQAGRFSEIFFSPNLPASLIWQLTFALVPNVIAFTCPMALLVGVIIGLAKMNSDSELTAIRAAGIGNRQILLPVTLLGIVLSFFAFVINWQGVPLAAQVVRKIALKTALYKLESPIEPGVFNTEIKGFTVYVRSGDILKGEWENIFIFNEDPQNGQVRLITSKNGKIDSDEEDSELVLGEALVSTFSTKNPKQPFVYEKVKDLRFVIQTKRREIVERLSKTEETPEELGLQELSTFAAQKEGKERTEAQILLYRRIILSFAPILFALLGASLVLRINRGGRGFGIFLALVSLVIFYLLALMGEQLARTGHISVIAGSLIPVIATIAAILGLNFSNRISSKRRFEALEILREKFRSMFEFNSGRAKTGRFSNVATGILDLDIITDLLKFFALSVGFLTAIYMIFTAFELWKFAGAIDNGFALLMRYLFYLLPFVYLQIAPSCLMIATLATFVIKSRQNEIVTWTAAGQSIYRLLLPCFLLMIFVGLLNWQLQERIAPAANRIQDSLRTQIRSRGVLSAKEGKFWLANDGRIYSFEADAEGYRTGNVKNLYLFEFEDEGRRLKAFTKAEKAFWKGSRIELEGDVRRTVWREDRVETKDADGAERVIEEDSNPFGQIYTKPSHLSARETSLKLSKTDSVSERRMYGVALEKKYTSIFLPFVITLFTAPFALSLSRKGKVVTVGYAVGIWLLFMGITNAFEQFGLNGYIAPEIAVWSPLLLFTILGGYLLTKVKT
jgi:Predicted permeases